METLYNGFVCEQFSFEGVGARVVSPEKGTEVGKLVFKTLYWGAFPDIEISLLRNGYHLAYLEKSSRFPTKDVCDRSARFIKYIAETYHLSEKCTLVGMSLGGAQAMRFAGDYPELVSCIYLDAPVLNYCDYPGKLGIPSREKVWEEEFLAVYPGMKRYQLMGFTEHPINAADTVLAHKIPILMVYGAEDTTVSYNEHGRLLEQLYEGSGLMKVVCVKFRGHHPHGRIGDNSDLVRFILENS